MTDQIESAGPPVERTGGNHYIDSIHLMRGIAALIVVLDHIVGRGPYAAFNAVFGFLDGLGISGVAAFFVISGIVLPLSLGAGYRLSGLPKFLLRRAVRIEFTYLASVGVAVAIIFIMSSVAPHGTPWLPSWHQLALHALYLIPFSSEDWIQPAYWTLAVEFQFYLTIGLLFPLIAILARRWVPLAAAACASFALLAFLWPVCEAMQLLKYAPCFALGMLVAGRRIFNFSTPLLVFCGLLVQGLALWSGLGPRVVFASTVAALIASVWTGRVNRNNPWVRPFWFLGTISYSLYVMHHVIVSAGENVARLLLRVMPGNTGLVLVNLTPLGTLTASLAAAWLLYRLVERPTLLVSRRMRGGNSLMGK